jgi:hypothetical protein
MKTLLISKDCFTFNKMVFYHKDCYLNTNFPKVKNFREVGINTWQPKQPFSIFIQLYICNHLKQLFTYEKNIIILHYFAICNSW